ncbi:MAG: nuclear transport factor 2 family protein [Rhodospirillaceae bacterium]|jgi:ketosteroid isomerase-like protein|nr:nuclear transport factor 2 family protein [Rhodospirillaceae bacterium]MBT4044567.1 nuclear transport factor 2 family protein [Rhodospirillaceae bacterium]MBT4688643.1 nuclear transport factor 2 family protein [Rhodospirillaceae bacterium]MBT5079007.1 nuclear transport factor 2 family protein [Rhodospirillaceae bacterium]MBT5523426.1 nuclear transport factor 2 family protein [Rhodospirillaceae bacterium]
MSEFGNSGHGTSDRIAIQELVHRYCDALCHRNHSALVDTFAADGVWDIGQGEVVGRDALSDKFRKVFELFEHVIQLTHNGEVKLDGNTAQGRWYITEYGLTTKGRRTFYICHYDDEYRRTADGWRFSRRTGVWHYQDAPDLSGQFGPPAGFCT